MNDDTKTRAAIIRRLVKQTDMPMREINLVASFIMANFKPTELFRKEYDEYR